MVQFRVDDSMFLFVFVLCTLGIHWLWFFFHALETLKVSNLVNLIHWNCIHVLTLRSNNFENFVQIQWEIESSKWWLKGGFIVEDLTNLSFECKLKGSIITKKIKLNICYWLENVQ
jgi:hypothetical protein